MIQDIEQAVKNLPKKIYLQLGFNWDEETEIDFKDLGEISWNNERVFNSDIEYVLNQRVNDEVSDTTVDAHSVAAGNQKTSCPYCGQYDSNCCPYPECDKPFSEQLNLLAEEIDLLADEIVGIMYKNSTDESDEGKWIEHNDYHKVSGIIAEKVLEMYTKGHEAGHQKTN